jgi:polar amino acid transport system substrate-binding protein
LNRRLFVCHSVCVPLMSSISFAATGSGPEILAVTEATAYSYMQDGKVAGVATDVVRKTLQDAGFTRVRLGVYPWARAYDMALHQPNVLIYLMARTPQRESQFKWVGEALAMQYHFYRLRDRRDIVIATLQDAKNFTVGVMRDDVRQDYLQAEGFRKLVVSSSNEQSFRQLLSGNIDLLALPYSDAASLSRQFEVAPGAIVPALTLPHLRTSLHLAYSRLTDDAVVVATRAAFFKVLREGAIQRFEQKQLVQGTTAVR